MKRIFTIKKQRSLDAIIEDSFKFFKSHIKEIIKIIWEQNKIIITGLVILYFLYFYFYFGMFNRLLNFKRSSPVELDSELFQSVYFGLIAIGLFILALIFIPRLFATVTGYLRYYNEENGEVDISNVKQLVKRKFWGLVGMTFLLIFLLVMVVALLFLLLFAVGQANEGFAVLLFLIIFVPLLFYASIYFTLVYYVYVFEDIDMFEAMRKTKNYLKNRFWFSFGVMFVMSLIIGLIGMVIDAPVSVYFFIKTILMVENQDIAKFAGQGDIVVSLFSVISYAGQLILRILMIIAISFLYFSIREYHTGESLYDKIDKIGVKDNDENL